MMLDDPQITNSLDDNKPNYNLSSLQFARLDEYIRITGKKLPHWHQSGKVQFVTFRLADSLPQEKLAEWEAKKKEWYDAHPKPWDSKTTEEYNNVFGEIVGKWLDAGYGRCILQYEDVRRVVVDALLFYHNKRYVLHSFVVMPNHVHVLVAPIGEDTVMKSIGGVKQHSSKVINKLLGRSGDVWQRLVFDRLVRSWKDYERYVNYIIANPHHLPPNTFSLWSAIDDVSVPVE